LFCAIAYFLSAIFPGAITLAFLKSKWLKKMTQKKMTQKKQTLFDETFLRTVTAVSPNALSYLLEQKCLGSAVQCLPRSLALAV